MVVMYTVIETPTFQKQADKIWSEDERLAFIQWLAANPEAGDVIPNAEGARKVRWHLKGAGKSGGVRVIYFNKTEAGYIYLIALYRKADQANMPPMKSKRGDLMNIEKITAAIEADAGEAIPGLKASLAEMEAGMVGRAYTPEQLLITEVRQTLKVSQSRFASLIDTPLPTLRDWEQGRFKPAGAVLCLLRLLRRHPEMAAELISVQPH